MTPKLKLLENVVQRLQNINEEKLGALYGLMYDGILLVIGFSIEVEGTSFQELQSHFPTEVDFCGIVTFKISAKEEITSSISDQLKEVLVSDNPILLNYNHCEKSLQAYFCHNEKLVEACYEVLTEADVCQLFAHIRLQTSLPLVCELAPDPIFEAINALQKKVSSGSVAFRISDTNVYLFGDEMEGVSPTVGELFSGTTSDHIEGSTRTLNQSKSSNNHQQPIDNLRVMRISLLQKCTRDSQTEGGLFYKRQFKTPFLNAPVLQFTKRGQSEDTRRLKLMLPIDALSMVHLSRKASELYNVLVDSLCRSLRLLERHLSRGALPPAHPPATYHFRPPAIGHFFTIIYPKCKSDNELEPVRRTFHQQLNLPTVKPLFRPSNCHNFNKKASTSTLLYNVHEGLPASGVKDGEVGVVHGQYAYHHYMQDGKDDNGWGCAYRSLQTLASWFQLQGYTSREAPSHAEIQKCLVDLEDKPPSFIGSRQWIGSTEVNYCLDAMLGVTCRIMFVSSGEELSERGSELLMHFRTQGTPIMIGGGVLAHTILGVDFNRETGDIRFLVLDPHYTGEEDLHIIQSKGWVGWKKTSFWDKKSFYNLCMPMIADESLDEKINYEVAANYWSKIPATVDGMLVGFGYVTKTDIEGSEKFLKSLFKSESSLNRERALDCGAGIGRITKNLLIKFFNKVDLVEQDQKFIQEAEKSIGAHENVGEFFNTGLQNLELVHKYDVIWCQWVLGYLTDDDLIKFFKKCVGHLKSNGVIVVKENLTSKGGVELDEEDSSVTRSYSVMHDVFKAADLKCVKELKQNNFPKFLYPVMMFALRPVT